MACRARKKAALLLVLMLGQDGPLLSLLHYYHHRHHQLARCSPDFRQRRRYTYNWLRLAELALPFC